MTYSKGHPVRLIGGRLALDFLNTADWSTDGQVVDEKIAEPADLDAWLGALELSEAARPDSIEAFHGFRRNLRAVFLGEAGGDLSGLQLPLRGLDIGGLSPGKISAGQPLLGLVAVSALSILSDARERGRVKVCPGLDCGWMFLDETKNARRKWCLMATCGNRAKASRHYRKVSRSPDRAPPG